MIEEQGKKIVDDLMYVIHQVLFKRYHLKKGSDQLTNILKELIVSISLVNSFSTQESIGIIESSKFEIVLNQIDTQSLLQKMREDIQKSGV